MARKNDRPIDFDAIGADLAKMVDVKRRIIEAGTRRGNPDSARRLLEEIRTHIRSVRQGLEMMLHDGEFEDMTAENAQQAIYACRIFEDSFREEDLDLRH
jgi:hypothetical protein